MPLSFLRLTTCFRKLGAALFWRTLSASWKMVLKSPLVVMLSATISRVINGNPTVAVSPQSQQKKPTGPSTILPFTLMLSYACQRLTLDLTNAR